MSRLRWLVVGIGVLVVLAVGVPFAYIRFVEGDAPKALTVEDAGASAAATTLAGGAGTAATVATPASFDGTWTVGPGSLAGYRVKEVLFGQSTTAVGRTSAVTGRLQLSGTTVSSAQVVVDLTKVTSDQDRRDGQFRGRIMETSRFPTATFALTQPLALGSIPADGATVTAKASGTLALHGATRPVTVDLSVQRKGGTFKVSGTIPVTFADYGIGDPSFGPAQVGDRGEIEIAIALTKA